jgi:exodeoxyribonuclease-3
MRIISYNVNGIRAAIKKGFMDWIKTDPADVICLQETKASQADVDTSALNEIGFHVAVFSKIKPDLVEYGSGHSTSDEEGRVLQLHFKDVQLINAYFPSGTSGDIRQTFKYGWLDEFYTYLNQLREKKPKLILCGDYNIAHKEIDIHDPKGNKNSSGFLPAERDWMTKFLESGWIDSFRHFHPEPHRYSWWSQRFPSVRVQNKGWRIDYINVTEPLKKQLKSAEIYPDIKHSDHCPVYLDIKI